MLRSGRVVLCYIVLASTVLCLPILGADEPKETVPPAPIPAQILTGKKVFIANAGVNAYYLPAYITSHTGAPTGLYDEFYAAIKSWGKYELVSAPADADLVFEISLNGTLTYSDPLFRLRILDPKTHIVLWAFIENVPAGSGREASRRKDWDLALGKLVNDVRTLFLQRPPIPGAQSK
jgi:hypothetical protein